MKLTVCGRRTSDTAPREPSLGEMLNDPVVRAVMRADRVNPNELARILRIAVRGRTFGGAGQPMKDRLSG